MEPSTPKVASDFLHRSLSIVTCICEYGLPRKGSKQNYFCASRTPANLEEHEILTSSGLYQRVYVQPNNNKTALITYHDIGTNHTSFLSLFNNPEMRVITENFTVYHICAPGHHENAPNLSFGEPGQDQVLLSQPDIQKQRQSVSSITGSRGSILEAVRRRSSLLLNRFMESIGMNVGEVIL
ncbi:unnamed protein product [Schistosoma turkestanicum]|nr:unnamed protein product [Schistosoma turkestanicum]